MMQTLLQGFSKLTREEKVQALIEQQKLAPELSSTLSEYLHPEKQYLFNPISENTVSNYYLPFSLAPNFLINDRLYLLPMVIEESSVVAAASKAATFWAGQGGFKTTIIDTIKIGQIFFTWAGDLNQLQPYKAELLQIFKQETSSITQNMRARGGGLIDFEFKPIANMDSTHQILVKFRTSNSMGANFINTCLETIAPHLMQFINQTEHFRKAGKAEHLMAILSNYTPECLVECRVSCATDQLKTYSGTYSPFEFAQRFKKAVEIAINDPYRAVTHNKGIFNGIDALALATGNDFRAIEAGAHAYACHNGSYSSLTNIHCDDSYFEYTLKVPLAMGTVGGLTKVHPLAKAALSILGNPTAAELMQITAAAGLANNFAAIASLVTTGIQKGHMKLHLANVLLALNANAAEEAYINHIFQNKAISFSMIATKLQEYRTK